ncbi:murein L,D-transpeptidase catalytic domain family protein [Novosphingobium nitrogenifigens]|nr:murein L,D-transpeptidase catalytic domain family protein [Novosphingobium nitrogenifigens]
MKFSRRHFIGAVAAGSAGLVSSRGFASVKSGEKPVLLSRAMAALKSHGASIPHHDMIGIVDFSAPSRVPRFQLVDVGNGRVVANLLVAHGSGSDPGNSGWVERLSNRPGSNASCQGSFLTGETYVGKHGHSRRLHGLDPDNSQAESRAIVVHAANYVDRHMAAAHGRIGRSQGCFAVSPDDISEVLARLEAGRLLYASK